MQVGFCIPKNMAFVAFCLNFLLSTNPEIRRSVTYTYLARVSLSYHIGSSCCTYNNIYFMANNRLVAVRIAGILDAIKFPNLDATND